MADISLVSRVRTRRNNSLKYGKNSKNITRKATSAIWRTFVFSKETRAKTLKEFERCLVKFDTDKMNFEPILATTKNRDIGYEYF